MRPAILLLIICWILGIDLAYAQNTEVKFDSIPSITPANDSLTPSPVPVLADTILPDTVVTDTLQPSPKGDIETTIDYSAEDSIIYDVVKQRTFLYGNAKVKYGDLTLEAAEIEVDMNSKTVVARGVADSTGTMQGEPIFTEQGVTYNAKEMTYNFASKKGIISGIVTEQGDGYIQGERVKKMDNDEMFMRGAIYTTCNLVHPHFGIRSRRLKVAPDRYVISGPFNMELNGIPTVLGFPFGMFPAKNERTSGLIFPDFGESQDRGFYLRGGGLYFALSDYVDLSMTTEFYTLGGWGLTLDSRYRKRYKYSGGLNFSYRKVVREQDDFSKAITNDYWIRWNHSPQTKGASRFSASVNAGTSTYNQNNSVNFDNYVNPAFNSNISYSRTLGSFGSLGVNLRHNQNVRTEIVNVTPDISLNMNRVYPFRKKGGGGKKNFITQTSFSYSGQAKGELTNNLAKRRSFGFEVVDLEQENDFEEDTIDFFSNFTGVLDNMEYGARHSIPLSTSINISYFTLSPSINYTEYWYPRRYNYTWVDELDAVVVEEENEFSRAYEFSTSASLQTRFYAFYEFKGDFRIRHMFTPTVSFSYRPDFSTPDFDYYQDVQVDKEGTIRRVSRFQGGIFGSPGLGESKSMSFGLSNQLEAKVRTKNDSTQKYKKIPILQSLNIRGSYDFARDSFQLSNISFSARTTLFGDIFPNWRGFNVNFGGTLDPYVYEITKTDPITGKITGSRRVDKLMWDEGQGLGRVSRVNLGVTTRFQPPKSKKQKDQERKNEDNPVMRDIMNNPERYVDFNIPWSLSVNYTISSSRTGLQDPNTVQTLNFSGDISLTEKWKVGFRSGYDFKEKDLAFTSINIHRDLHCWQMSLNWIPFGPRTSYNIDIAVKSSILQDLKISKRDSWYDR
ncbi:putative LPS assembly protein LptD [Rapidithrix thailandica]|uniref:LPS assembly protein LptD n=1 Tax=Rapidithrix thailandica TaxID=413964 RepID=A0AAW9S886_9BACT